MPQAVAHFSQHLIDGTTLQVAADDSEGLARLIETEQAVIRRYAERQDWPHRQINLFVVQDLQPLIAQIQRVAALPAVVADDLDRRPMVNVYDVADLSECTVFVNRGAIERDGLWQDELALCGLLAHEHGHPLAENKTVAEVRRLALRIAVDSELPALPENALTAVGPDAAEDGNGVDPSDGPKSGVAQILLVLLSKLSVKAPQEIFANEIAIRAGFGDALFHLDERVIETARQAVAKRVGLIDILDRECATGRLDARRKALLLLVGDLQASLPFALETAPFLRSGERSHAETLDARLAEGLFAPLSPEVAELYRLLRDHYLALQVNLSSREVKNWCGGAVSPLVRVLGETGLTVTFDLAVPEAQARRAQAAGNRTQRRRSEKVDPR